VRFALAALVAAACTGAEAQQAPLAGLDRDAGAATAPPTYVTIPAGWQVLPEVGATGVAAARATVRSRATTRAQTWGDPGLGCFVTIVDVTGARPTQLAEVAEELRGVLAATLAVEDWSTGGGPSIEVGGAISKGSMRGRVRARLVAEPSGVPHAAVAACFYNQREPARCQDACTRVLATLEAPKVMP